MATLMIHPQLGRILCPHALMRSTILPGGRIASRGEIGVFAAVQQRPNVVDTVIQNGQLTHILHPERPYDLVWASVTHNERVDAGADKQSRQVHGGGSAPGAPSATAYFNVIAIASATLTKAKGDQSLGSTSAGVTTNEFTTIGLSRAVATITAGNYTVPSSLGGTFSQVISRQFTASGTGTAFGAGIFDSTTVAGSILYVQDNFATNAALVSGDTLTVTVTITN